MTPFWTNISSIATQGYLHRCWITTGKYIWCLAKNKSHNLINLLIFLSKNGQTTLPYRCLWPSIWGGARILGLGFESGWAMLLVHVQHPQRYASMFYFYVFSFVTHGKWNVVLFAPWGMLPFILLKRQVKKAKNKIFIITIKAF